MTLFSLIKKGTIHLGKGAKVIPAEDFSELLSAREIVEKAHEEAKLLIHEAHEKGKDIRQKAHDAGFQEGLKELNKHIDHFDQKTKQFAIELEKLVLPL